MTSKNAPPGRSASTPIDRRSDPAETTPDLRFFAAGVPAPKGSKRHVGNGRMIESSTRGSK